MTTRTHVNGARKRKRAASSHFDGLIDGAEALVAATADIGEDKLGDVRSRLQKDLEAARAQLDKLEEDFKGELASIDDYVHEKPWQSIGVAAASSALIGILIGATAFRR